MPYPFHNAQLDPMTLTLAGGAVVNVPGNGNVNAAAAIDHITYHRLTYDRVGGWVVADGTALTARYPGEQNINVRLPDGSEVVYHYNGP